MKHIVTSVILLILLNIRKSHSCNTACIKCNLNYYKNIAFLNKLGFEGTKCFNVNEKTEYIYCPNKCSTYVSLEYDIQQSNLNYDSIYSQKLVISRNCAEDNVKSVLENTCNWEKHGTTYDIQCNSVCSGNKCNSISIYNQFMRNKFKIFVPTCATCEIQYYKSKKIFSSCINNENRNENTICHGKCYLTKHFSVNNISKITIERGCTNKRMISKLYKDIGSVKKNTCMAVLQVSCNGVHIMSENNKINYKTPSSKYEYNVKYMKNNDESDDPYASIESLNDIQIGTHQESHSDSEDPYASVTFERRTKSITPRKTRLGKWSPDKFKKAVSGQIGEDVYAVVNRTREKSKDVYAVVNRNKQKDSDTIFEAVHISKKPKKEIDSENLYELIDISKSRDSENIYETVDTSKLSDSENIYEPIDTTKLGNTIESVDNYRGSRINRLARFLQFKKNLGAIELKEMNDEEMTIKSKILIDNENIAANMHNNMYLPSMMYLPSTSAIELKEMTIKGGSKQNTTNNNNKKKSIETGIRFRTSPCLIFTISFRECIPRRKHGAIEQKHGAIEQINKKNQIIEKKRKTFNYKFKINSNNQRRYSILPGLLRNKWKNLAIIRRKTNRIRAVALKGTEFRIAAGVAISIGLSVLAVDVARPFFIESDPNMEKRTKDDIDPLLYNDDFKESDTITNGMFNIETSEQSTNYALLYLPILLVTGAIVCIAFIKSKR